MSDISEFPETFDLDRFIPDMEFNAIIDRFENGRTPDKIPKHKNKVLTVEEFTQETKPTKPEKMSREDLIKHLETLEKQIEEQHTN
jgi:hypothetical protein